MQISVFFSFLVYTESEYTITTNLHIVKKFLGLFAKKTAGNWQKSATYKNHKNDNIFISTIPQKKLITYHPSFDIHNYF